MRPADAPCAQLEALEPRLLLDAVTPSPAEADPTLASEPPPDRYQVVVDPARTYQTMDGIGANSWALAFGGSGDWNWNAVRPVFEELDLHYIRMCPWLGWWETTNDNADPWSTDWSAFGKPNNFARWWEVPFGQYLTGRGIDMDLWVGGFADWVKDGQTYYPAHMDAEAGEYLASYVKNLVNNGVPQPVTEMMNEPDIGQKYSSAYRLRDAAKVLLAQLDRFGLTDTMLQGPGNHRPAGTAEWARVWLADPQLRARTQAVSYHTWWDAGRAPYEAIRQVAADYDLPVWATEVGYIAVNIHPDSWTQALEFAQSHFRAIAWSDATRSYHWSVLGHDSAIGPNGERTATFYTLKHIANFIPPGAVRVEAAGNFDTGLQPMAFQLPDGRYSLVVINSISRDMPLDLFAIGGSSYRAVQAVTSRSGHYEQPLDSTGTGDQLMTLTLPARSVTSFILEPAAGLPGDVNADGRVDDRDLGTLLAWWGVTGTTERAGDVNGDGHIDDRERALITEQIDGLGADAELHDWVQRQLEAPLDAEALARQADSPQAAREMYLVSVAVVDDQNPMERAWLDQLGGALGLEDGMRQELERQALGA